MCENQGKPTAMSKIVDRYSKSKDKSISMIVLQPYYYMESNPGKRLIKNLAGLWNMWLKISDEKLATVLDIIEIVQNCSLLIDDIEDGSTMRRSLPTAHIIYGVRSTLSSAGCGIHYALRLMMEFIKPEETRHTVELMLQLLRGQGMELYWRDHNVCPTIDEYKEMVIGKTGTFFKMMTFFMQMYSTEQADLTKLAEILGLAYQIADDYKNLTSAEYMKTKSFCEDITEGKFSFPILHAIHSHPEDQQILDILRQRTTDRATKLRCLSLLKKYGSLVYTKNVIAELCDEIIKEAQKLGHSAYMEGMMDFIFKDVF